MLELSSSHISSSLLFCVGAVGELNADGMSSAVYSFEIARVNADGGWGDINALIPFWFALLHLLGFCAVLLARISLGFDVSSPQLRTKPDCFFFKRWKVWENLSMDC